jgi:hypothetical protein
VAVSFIGGGNQSTWRKQHLTILTINILTIVYNDQLDNECIESEMKQMLHI